MLAKHESEKSWCRRWEREGEEASSLDEGQGTSLRHATIKDKTHADVRAFQDNTKSLKVQHCHTQKPTLHLKGHIWGGSARKKLWLWRPYRLKLEVWSTTTWKARMWGRTPDWMQGKTQRRACLVPSVCLCHHTYGRLRLKGSYSGTAKVKRTPDDPTL